VLGWEHSMGRLGWVQVGAGANKPIYYGGLGPLPHSIKKLIQINWFYRAGYYTAGLVGSTNLSTW